MRLRQSLDSAINCLRRGPLNAHRSPRPAPEILSVHKIPFLEVSPRAPKDLRHIPTQTTVLALAHNYERLREVPSDETNGVGVCDVGDQYSRGTRSSYALANWIRSQGYHADPYPGPMAGALLLVPPAIAGGLGELGKHGSLISPRFGAGVRLAGVTTDMPLVSTGPVQFGADEFCATCQICTNACPPGAISPQKQMVRGVERWYVNFDQCIPYFSEAASCGICIAECPWTRPSIRPKLLTTMDRRSGKR
jgi:epoxyqueuosine reductase